MLSPSLLPSAGSNGSLPIRLNCSWLTSTLLNWSSLLTSWSSSRCTEGRSFGQFFRNLRNSTFLSCWLEDCNRFLRMTSGFDGFGNFPAVKSRHILNSTTIYQQLLPFLFTHSILTRSRSPLSIFDQKKVKEKWKFKSWYCKKRKQETQYWNPKDLVAEFFLVQMGVEKQFKTKCQTKLHHKAGVQSTTCLPCLQTWRLKKNCREIIKFNMFTTFTMFTSNLYSALPRASYGRGTFCLQTL